MGPGTAQAVGAGRASRPYGVDRASTKPACLPEGRPPHLVGLPYYHVPRVRPPLLEPNEPAAGAARGKKLRHRREHLRCRLDFLEVFRPVKWIGLVFGRYLAVSGQDWVINDDRTLSQTCVFQCYSQIMKELTFAFRNTMLTFQVFLEIIKNKLHLQVMATTPSDSPC